MITLVGLALFGLACVGFASDALQGPESERAPQRDSAPKTSTLDALLFLLCLVGVLHATSRKRECDEFDG